MSQTLDQVLQMSADKRYTYLLTEVRQHNQLWILTDEHGCVILTTEDEDCVPIWPAQEFAQYWATGDWAHCVPEAISLTDWLNKWTSGLQGDEVNIAVFPNPEEEGLIVFPDDLDTDLRKK
ncbi:MAG: hypothetical protein ACJAVV_002141 [Alphaproteobacteria bacterium]|jgi:hypothetical protein